MKRIVFVDDEQAVLDGLRNLLRKRRQEWDMSFALGGRAGLAELERAPCDVIVTDMRMPGLDGPALLEIVKERFPGTARLVLSGHADRESIVRATPFAHQFLCKPCDAATLMRAIERTFELASLVQSPEVRAVIGRMGRLPSAPHTYLALSRAMEDPDSTVCDLARIVETDPAMTTKILQLVNSSFFGLGRSIASIEKAVSLLGLDLIRALALTAHVFGSSDGDLEELDLEALQRSSVLTARVARQLVRDRGPRDEAFTAGIVHDVGKIVLGAGQRDEYRRILRCARESGRPAHEVEREQLGTTHAEIGAYLLGMWGLPFAIVEAVAFHHRPGEAPAGADQLLAVVHVADALVESTPGLFAAAEPPHLDEKYLERAGITSCLSEWRERATREIAAALSESPRSAGGL